MRVSRPTPARLTALAAAVVFVLAVVPALLVLRGFAASSARTDALVDTLVRDHRARTPAEREARAALERDGTERTRDVGRYGAVVVLRGLLACSFVVAGGALLMRSRRNAALARVDEVSGLANRRAFVERLEGLLERRRSHERLAVLYVDLDGFKPVNDAFGHAVGDRVLRACGQRIRTALRPSDLVARLGGDEFGVILTEIEDDAPSAVAERLRGAVEQPIALGEHSALVGASIGIALVPEAGTAPGVVLRAADEAMYRRKRQRRDGTLALTT